MDKELSLTELISEDLPVKTGDHITNAQGAKIVFVGYSLKYNSPIWVKEEDYERMKS